MVFMSWNILDPVRDPNGGPVPIGLTRREKVIISIVKLIKQLTVQPGGTTL